MESTILFMVLQKYTNPLLSGFSFRFEAISLTCMAIVGTMIELLSAKSYTMKQLQITLVLFLMTALALPSFGQKTIPDVNIANLKGQSVNVAEYARNGKITIISFWALWCTPCKKELNNIKDIYGDWVDDYDVELIALSIDDARNIARVKSYVDGQGWEYIILLDKNQDLKRALNFQTIPYTILLDQKGNIVYSHSAYVEGDEYVLEDEIKKLVK
jgi:thiol-disulfide isomerase/thioredoxin